MYTRPNPLMSRWPDPLSAWAIVDSATVRWSCVKSRDRAVDGRSNNKEAGYDKPIVDALCCSGTLGARGAWIGSGAGCPDHLADGPQGDGGDLKSIQYSGSTGYVAAVGQNYSPANDWPANQLTSYTRTIDYDAKSSKEELTLKQGTGQGGPTGGGNAPLITTPLVGEQQRTSMVSGNYAWNMQGTTVVPAPADAEQRQLEIWLTPHGCLKAALAPGANPIAIDTQ